MSAVVMNALMRVKRGGGLHVAIGVAMLIDRWVRVRGSFACWSAIGPRCSISPLLAGLSGKKRRRGCGGLDGV